MEPDLSKYVLVGDSSTYAGPDGLVVPVVTRAGDEPGDTGQSAGASRISGVSIQHTPATRIWFGKVSNEAGYRSVPHHHGEAETGGYVLSGRARIYFGERYEDYLDMEEGDWVFVPPFMPHVECNIDRNRPLTWMTTRTPENIVVNLAQVPDTDLRNWVDPTVTSGTSQALTDAITLTEVEPERFDRAFLATTQPCPWPKAYGGDPVAQAAAVAMRTVTDGKALHSMHSYFLRPIDIGGEVRYEVEVLRDGRGYSARQVRGFQHDKPVYAALASFAAGEPSPSFASPLPADLPSPDELPSSAAYLAGREGGTMTAESKAYWSGGRSVDMRHVPGPVYLTVEGNHEPHQAIWVRPFDPLRPVDGLTDAQRDTAALAYLCDYTILEPLLRTLGVAWAMPGLVTASLDHAMWFHRPAHLDGWILYAQEAVSCEDGRGLATGRLFTADGTHLATVAQEGMLRVPQETAP